MLEFAVQNTEILEELDNKNKKNSNINHIILSTYYNCLQLP